MVPGRAAAAGDDHRSAVRRRRARAAAGAAAAAAGRRRAAGRGGAPRRRARRGAPGRSRPPAPQRGAAPGGAAAAPPVFGSFPIAYKVQVSMDGKTWGAPVAQGEGSPATTIATFRPVQAKFVRVTQTGSAESARLVGAELPRLRGGS